MKIHELPIFSQSPEALFASESATAETALSSAPNTARYMDLAQEMLMWSQDRWSIRSLTRLGQEKWCKILKNAGKYDGNHGFDMV